jgi:hypothetical protein
MKGWLIGLGVVVAIVLLAIGGLFGLYAAMRARFNPPAPAAVVVAGATPLEAQREDIAQFGRLIALDRAYAPAARREANAELAALAARPEVLPEPMFRMALLHVAALADNGHTAAYPAKGGRPNAVPLRLYDFTDSVRVVRAKASEADLLGAEVTAIAGRPTQAVIAALTRYRGGRPNNRRNWAVQAMISPQMLFGAGLAPGPTHASWTFRTLGGQTVERDLIAEPRGDDDPSPDPPRWLSPAPLPKETADWRALLPATARLPLALQDANRLFRFAWVDGCVAFLQLKANVDEDGQSIAAFQQAARAELKRRQACGAILDLRYDGGGDYTTTASFSHDLPGLIAPGAKIALMTGVDTFSAGITTAAFVKQAGGDRVVIVGASVGDRLNFMSEGASGCLPHDKLCFHYTTGRHRYNGPCGDWRTCYWLSWLFPVRVKTLAPDAAVSLSFADYQALRDPAFDRALALVHATR